MKNKIKEFKQSEEKIEIKLEFKNFLETTAEQKADLEKQIKKDGRIFHPLIIARYVKDNITYKYLANGHNRYEIAQKYNLPYEVIVNDFENEAEVFDWIYEQQKNQRNWSEWQQLLASAKLKEKLSELGREKSKQTVGRPKKSMTHPVINLPKFRTRTIIGKKLGWSEGKVSRAEDVLKNASPEIINKLSTGKITLKEVFKIRDKEKLKLKRTQEAKEAKKIILPQSVDLRHGDFNKVLEDIPDGSLDIILTDPPYLRKFLECWSELSAFAVQKLKPSGFLVTYSGQYHLPEVIRRLEENLEWYWLISMHQKDANGIVPKKNINCLFKPVLVFQKPPTLYFTKPISDEFDGGNREKKYHEWQQSSEGVRKLIEIFSKEGDLICDPFVGGGTVPALCKEMNRSFIGAEIDEQSYCISLKRIAETSSKDKPDRAKRKVIYHSAGIQKEQYIFPDTIIKRA